MKTDSLLIGAKEVSQLLNISRTLTYELARSNRFPKPIKLNSKTLWRRDVIEIWVSLNCPQTGRIESLIRSQRKKENRAAVKGLAEAYIRQLLTERTSLSNKDIPQVVVDAKREVLRNKRILKEM